MNPRAATPDELPVLARIWHDSWHEAHAKFVPEALNRMRTPEEFVARLSGYGDQLRAIGPAGKPVGLCVVIGSELSQLFVDRKARGSGPTETLLVDGETRMRDAGTKRAFLKCIPENLRALRFYKKHGWSEDSVQMSKVETSSGKFEIPCMILTKTLLLKD